MPIDSVGSYDDIYSDDIEIQGLKAFDTSGAEWYGRRVMEAQDERDLYSILVASVAYEQAAERKISATVGSDREKKYESRAFSDNGSPTYNFNNPFLTLPSSFSSTNKLPPQPMYVPSPSQLQVFTPTPIPPQQVFVPSLPQPSFFPSSQNYNPPSLIKPTLSGTSSLLNTPPTIGPFTPAQLPSPPPSVKRSNFSPVNPIQVPSFANNSPPTPTVESLISSEAVRSSASHYSLPSDGISSNASHSLTNLEVQKALFSPTPTSIPSVPTQNINLILKEESWTDFVRGFAKGLPEGSLGSVKEIPSAISGMAQTVAKLDSLINPIVPNQKLASQITAVSETMTFLGSCSGSELAKAVVPEVHQLFTNWDNLSYEERGSLTAHCIGKYGTDFLLPGVIAKGIKIAGPALKESAVFGKIEGVIGAAAKEAGGIDAVLDSSKLAKGSIPLAEQQTVVQKYLLSEELERDVAEVIENTRKAIQSEAFAEGKAFAEEINSSLINSKFANPQISRNFTDVEKELFSTAFETNVITRADLNLQVLLQAGLEPDRAGLTKAGRALMKHGNREGSIFPKPKGNAGEVNVQGQKVLEAILNHPEKVIYDRPHPDFGRVIDIMTPEEGGVRFTPTGKMIGFLEPKIKG